MKKSKKVSDASIFDLTNVADLPEDVRPKKRGRPATNNLLILSLFNIKPELSGLEIRVALWRRYHKKLFPSTICLCLKSLIHENVIKKVSTSRYRLLSKGDQS